MARTLPVLFALAAAHASGTARADEPDQAAQGPIPAPVSAAENALPGPGDTPASARGRRSLSTAFVRIGPDGLLTVTRRDGRVLVLRDVVMREEHYCGRQVSGNRVGKLSCATYADVAAARPGGAPMPDPADPGAGRPAPAKRRM